jgi:hypothetical protein
MAMEFYRTPIGLEIVLKATQIPANHKIKVTNIIHEELVCSTLLKYQTPPLHEIQPQFHSLPLLTTYLSPRCIFTHF